jgi:tRNA threonylcarbamoyl adenosine modification protein YeaZ
MNILAIECSSQQGSVAVFEGGGLAKSWQFESPRGRGSSVFGHLESALREVPQIDRVVVGTGPGSYNGLRLSISAAWGIARARNAELGGLSSLLGYDSEEYFALGDARAGQWFVARIADGKFVTPPALLPPEDVFRLLEPGVPVFATSCLRGLPDAVVAAPSAAILARRDFVEGLPQPLYLKPPHITKPSA